jgi:hypothetical protein
MSFALFEVQIRGIFEEFEAGKMYGGSYIRWSRASTTMLTRPWLDAEQCRCGQAAVAAMV